MSIVIEASKASLSRALSVDNIMFFVFLGNFDSILYNNFDNILFGDTFTKEHITSNEVAEINPRG